MKYYLNLTNGIEWVQELNVPIKDIGCIRIQSTKCEQKDWSYIIEDLDYQFLLDLALGEDVIVLDCSPKKDVSRALYQGVEWIKYVLNRRWFDREENCFVKGNKVNNYFNEEYKLLSRRAKNKLDYVKKFLLTDRIYLQGMCKTTSMDSNYEGYKQILKGVFSDECSEII
jgi:hypothetical protein